MAKCYLVGGAVRDELMGQQTNDYDYVVVGATYDELAASYGDPVGADFPVFIDPTNGDQIAMARRERKTGVGYHGFTCDFGSDVTLEEDLSRRDLTINALAKDCESGEIIDYFGGLEDMKNKTLRHVSDAFAEDPLRVVRLARFGARYGDFSIAPETRVLAQQVVDSGELNHLPYERYWLEIQKAVDDGNVGHFFRVLALFGVFTKVKFFNEVWGDSDIVMTLKNIDRVGKALRYVREAYRFTFLVALTAKKDLSAKVQGLTTTAFAVHQGITRVNAMSDLEVEPLFELLKTTKAWQNGSIIELVILGVEVLNNAGHITAIFPDELKEFVRDVREVTSEPYQHLQGPAIGIAMNNERKARIARLIEVF